MVNNDENHGYLVDGSCWFPKKPMSKSQSQRISDPRNFRILWPHRGHAPLAFCGDVVGPLPFWLPKGQMLQPQGYWMDAAWSLGFEMIQMAGFDSRYICFSPLLFDLFNEQLKWLTEHSKHANWKASPRSFQICHAALAPNTQRITFPNPGLWQDREIQGP